MKKLSKKIASLILALALFFSMTQSVFASPPPPSRVSICDCGGSIFTHYEYGTWITVDYVDCTCDIPDYFAHKDKIQERSVTKVVQCNNCGAGYEDDLAPQTRTVHCN